MGSSPGEPGGKFPFVLAGKKAPKPFSLFPALPRPVWHEHTETEILLCMLTNWARRTPGASRMSNRCIRVLKPFSLFFPPRPAWHEDRRAVSHVP